MCIYIYICIYTYIRAYIYRFAQQAARGVFKIGGFVLDMGAEPSIAFEVIFVVDM